MSRSWTPQEMYYADKAVNNNIRNSKLYFIQPDGTKIPMESEQARKVRKQYKELGFLFDDLPKTYEILKNHPKYRARVLKDIEEHLENIENAKSGRDDDIVWLWYTGRLDKNFYYNEYNNQLFTEYILKEVQKLIKY